MRRVNIDFAPPGIARAVHHASFAVSLLGTCGLMLCGASGVIAWQAAAVERADDAGLAAARARARRPAASGAAVRRPPVPDEQARAVNAIVARLNLPWRALHDAIDAATPAGVALLALEPAAKRGTVRISAEARSPDDMIGYVERLKQQRWFSDVTLASHQIDEQDPNRPMRFQLDVKWGESQ